MSSNPRIDVFATANIGVFGLALPDDFAGTGTGDEAEKAVKELLRGFSFPALNITYSANGRLREKGNKKLKNDLRLERLELRGHLEAQDQNGDLVADELCTIVGLLPYGTEAAEKEPAVQLTPNLSDIFTAIPGLASSQFLGVLSGLNLVFSPLLGKRYPIVRKAFLSSSREFGWYLDSEGAQQQEGLHFGTVLLQAHRDVRKIQLELDIATDWKNSENEFDVIKTTLELHHPEPPKTPILRRLKTVDDLPLVLSRADVRHLLEIDDVTIDQLIDDGKLSAYGDKKQITKGSVIRLLELQEAS